MSISFLEPLFLFGLIALSIPIIIHLVNRNKAIIHHFAAIDFILASYKRVAKQFKIQKLLLLIVRLLILAVITLALSKPYLSNKDSQNFNNEISDNIIIIDNSYSMGFLLNNGISLFEKAKKISIDLVNSFSDNARIALLILNEEVSPIISDFTYDKEKITKAISEQKLSYNKTDFGKGLKYAFELLSNSLHENKNIYILTDLTLAGWKEKEFPIINKNLNSPQIKIIDIAPQNLDNIVISSLLIENASYFLENNIKITAEIINYSSLDLKNLHVKLVIDDHVKSEGFLDLKKGEKGYKTFFVTLPSGTYRCTVKIDDSNLELDNFRYGVISVFSQVETLIVDGDPKTNFYESETFYLDKAFNHSKLRSPIVSKTCLIEEVINLLTRDKYDMLILANVPEISLPISNLIKNFVKNGGGLLITVGDKVNPDSYNTNLGELLPKMLRVSKEVAKKNEESLDVKAEYLSYIDFNHPITSIFLTLSNISSAKFYKYFLLESELENDAYSIIKYSSLAPALLEKKFGKGKVILYTSTIDRDWNDFPIEPTFLPLIYQIILYATNHSFMKEIPQIIVNDIFELNVAKELLNFNFEITNPLGDKSLVTVENTPKESFLRFKETKFPGFYYIKPMEEIKGYPELFSVNLDSEESNLQKITKEEIKSILGDNISIIDNLSEYKDSIIGINGLKLWQSLLIITGILLFIEGILTKI